MSSLLTVSVRLIVGIVAAVAGLFGAVLAQAIWPNVVYWITLRGKVPNRRPVRLWVVFIASAACTVLGQMILNLIPSSGAGPVSTAAGAYGTAGASDGLPTTGPVLNLYVLFSRREEIGLPSLFSADPGDAHNAYVLTTDSCMQATFDGRRNDIGAGSPEELTGYLSLGLTSNIPLVLQQLTITVTDVAPVEVPDYPSPFVDFLAVGGGGWVPKVNLPPITISAARSTYEVLHGDSYRLDAEDAVIFVVPVTFLGPASYTYEAVGTGDVFRGNEETVTSPPSTIRWFFLPDLDISDINVRSPDIVLGPCP